MILHILKCVHQWTILGRQMHILGCYQLVFQFWWMYTLYSLSRVVVQLHEAVQMIFYVVCNNVLDPTFVSKFIFSCKLFVQCTVGLTLISSQIRWFQSMWMQPWPHPETRPPVMWKGKIWKLRFWTGSYMSWTGPPDGAVQNRPYRFVAWACPSMPFYNVNETATKLVTVNVDAAKPGQWNVSLLFVQLMMMWCYLC